MKKSCFIFFTIVALKCISFSLFADNPQFSFELPDFEILDRQTATVISATQPIMETEIINCG